MQIKHESLSTIKGSRLLIVHEDDVKDGIFNCPEEVEFIGADAFNSCKQSITVLNLNNVQCIEINFFTKWPNLTTVNAPQVKMIEWGAFGSCPKLTTVDLPKVTTIPGYAFHNCSELTSVNLSQVEQIKTGAFECCEKLATIDLPKVVTLEDNSFHQCIALTTVNAPQLEKLGNTAFSECKKLVTLNLSKVTTIERYTFFNCVQLATLILHPAVKLDFNVNNANHLNFIFKNLKQIIINDVENRTFDKDAFIAQLPSHLKSIKTVLTSELLIENLCYVKEILQQHDVVLDVKSHIFSFYRQLPFVPRVEEDLDNALSCSII